jgi:hypothetical protein
MKKETKLNPRELAYGGLFGAAGLTFPLIFRTFSIIRGEERIEAQRPESVVLAEQRIG